jgi:anthranilate phosphoribosyltransferase
MSDATLDLKGTLRKLAEGETLDTQEAETAFAQVVDGSVGEASIAALLTALRIRGESPIALLAAVRVVRSRMAVLEIPERLRPLLDTCGTGGDGARTFNISTATALIVAACGVRVAKHGNRSASGVSGSADVLTELGVRIDPSNETIVRCLDEVGIAYLHAPRFHPALRNLAAVRSQLPFRTVFNDVGPLANPARPEIQLIGVSNELAANRVTEVLARLAVQPGNWPSFACVVHGPGLDEVSLSGTTQLRAIPGLTGIPRSIEAIDLGLEPSSLVSLQIESAAQSAGLIQEILAGRQGPAHDIVVANAAVALVLAKVAIDLRQGVMLAAEAVESGAAAKLLWRWKRLSNE